MKKESELTELLEKLELSHDYHEEAMDLLEPNQVGLGWDVSMMTAELTRDVFRAILSDDCELETLNSLAANKAREILQSINSLGGQQ